MKLRITPSVLIAMCLLFSGSGSAQESVSSEAVDNARTFSSVIERYPSGAITSTETAAQALADVKQQSALIETQFAENEAACYEKFFVTFCLDKAKQRRRMALKQLESIEVEANAYNRRARVEERDQALRERQAKQEARASERADTQAKDENLSAPASPGDISDVEAQARQASSAPSAVPAKNYNRERAAQHAQDLAKEKEQERAEAQKRAENIRAYEKKQQRSLERQREIAAEKEAKESRRAAKESEPAEKKTK